MKTIKQFIREHGIKIRCEYANRNPSMPDWRDANHFKVCLTARNGDGRRHQMTLHFSQGYGIQGEPDAASVLDCLASDASTVDGCNGFEDWASELLYDVDSRKAEQIGRAHV